MVKRLFGEDVEFLLDDFVSLGVLSGSDCFFLSRCRSVDDFVVGLQGFFRVLDDVLVQDVVWRLVVNDYWHSDYERDELCAFHSAECILFKHLVRFGGVVSKRSLSGFMPRVTVEKRVEQLVRFGLVVRFQLQGNNYFCFSPDFMSRLRGVLSV